MSKHRGIECHGAHLIVTDFSKLKAFEAGLHLLSFLKNQYRDFSWVMNQESNYFIDYLLGTSAVRMAIDGRACLDNNPSGYAEPTLIKA
jgi:uncharacterized protein YbbC (DUF1343 family)